MISNPGIPKPGYMAESEWAELGFAARSSWRAYVLPWRWLIISFSAMATGVFLGGWLFAGQNLSGAWRHLFNAGFLTWGISFLIFFRVLFSSIDLAGKRKLARQIGLLASAPPKS